MVKNKKITKYKKTTVLEDIFVSVVLVIDRDTSGSADYVQNMSDVLAGHYTNYEIVLVDNGADLTEINEVAKLLEDIPCIRIISLSRHSRADTAIFAGLEAAIGDFVCTLNPAVDPLDKLVDIIRENQSRDVVQGVSSVSVNGVLGSQLGRKLFYWYNRKYIGIDIPLNATFFAAYNRAAVNGLTATERSHRHIRHLVRLIGYKPSVFLYEPTQNPGSQRSLRTGIIEALEITASYSSHPLRFVTWVGVFAGFVNILYAIYVVILNLTKVHLAEGWTTTSLQLSSMFFVLFMIMVILAEYIGRILTESLHEPRYYISEERSSTISLADTNRRNITK